MYKRHAVRLRYGSNESRIIAKELKMGVLADGKKFLERFGADKIEPTTLQLFTEQSLHSELISSLEKYGFSLWNHEPGFNHEILGRIFQYEAVLNPGTLLNESNAI